MIEQISLAVLHGVWLYFIVYYACKYSVNKALLEFYLFLIKIMEENNGQDD